jgi:hypothetical protein
MQSVDSELGVRRLALRQAANEEEEVIAVEQSNLRRSSPSAERENATSGRLSSRTAIAFEGAASDEATA